MVSESEWAQTWGACSEGVRTCIMQQINSWTLLESWTKQSNSLVDEIDFSWRVSRVAQDTWNPVWMWEDHLLRLNTTWWPIAYSTVRERWKGPREGSEREPETLCLQIDVARLNVWHRTFCRTGRRVTLRSEVKQLSCGAVAKASLKLAF